MGFVGNYLMNLGSMGLAREPARPLLFSYYVTHRCELACRYCCDGDGKRFKEERIPELGPAEAKRLVSLLRRDTDTLDITGGEPMLRDDLEEILGHARALELLNRYRPDRRNRVHMITVLMDDNLEEIEPLIKLSRDLGVTYMVNLYSWNRGSKRPRLPEGSVTDVLLGLKARYPDFVTLTTYIEHLDRAIAEGGIGNCKTGRLLLNIDNRGNVARCTERIDEPVGNILTEDAFEIRKRLWKVQRENDCSQCWTSCRGFAESMFLPPRLRQYREFYRSVKSH